MEGDTHKRGPEGQKEEDTKGEQSRGATTTQARGAGEERVARTDELKRRRRLHRQRREQRGVHTTKRTRRGEEERQKRGEAWERGPHKGEQRPRKTVNHK